MISMELIRIISLAVLWGVGMIGGILAALSDSDWAERFAVRCGDDPASGGRVVRFGAVCFGVFMVPVLHVLAWEIAIFISARG